MRKVLLLFIWVCLLSPHAFAQVRLLSGKISAADDGLGLAGASIIYKGTNVGTNADADGNFSFSVPGDGTLVVSYVGLSDQRNCNRKPNQIRHQIRRRHATTCRGSGYCLWYRA
jgi:hypothetical protein